MLLSITGASFLWIGWFGFIAGSAYAANDEACIAFLNTQIAAYVI
jgi:Amt family ammonium transporter